MLVADVYGLREMQPDQQAFEAVPARALHEEEIAAARVQDLVKRQHVRVEMDQRWDNHHEEPRAKVRVVREELLDEFVHHATTISSLNAATISRMVRAAMMHPCEAL